MGTSMTNDISRNTAISFIEPMIDHRDEELVLQVLRSRWISEGKMAEKFLEELRALTGAKYAVLMPNATLALFVALKLAGVREGDEVIVPAFTYIASVNPILMLGAKPVFVDVDIRDANIDTRLVEKHVTDKTKAIVPVHLFGRAANMGIIRNVSEKYGLIIIEDAAEAIGARYEGKHVGTLGDMGCLSFFAEKTIAIGEGGAILTNDEKHFENLSYFRNQGRLTRGEYIHPRIGLNFRITDLQCALGVAQMHKFEEIVAKKTLHYEIYKAALADVRQITFFQTFRYSNHVPYLVNILAEDKATLKQHLLQNGIPCRDMFYPMPRQPCFGPTSAEGRFRNSDHIYSHGLSLPIHGMLSKEQIVTICEEIRSFYGP